MSIKTIQFKTQGTCCELISAAIDENNTVQDVQFTGGCRGNLEGIRRLISGMNIDDVISRVQGVKCGSKNTSCPDQLAKCLLEYKKSQGAAV